jgi:hypothetical protein
MDYDPDEEAKSEVLRSGAVGTETPLSTIRLSQKFFGYDLYLVAKASGMGTAPICRLLDHGSPRL